MFYCDEIDIQETHPKHRKLDSQTMDCARKHGRYGHRDATMILVALQHYLGHKNIQHTVRYTDMAPDRFKDFWRD